MEPIPLFCAEKAVHLKDEDYYHFLAEKISESEKSVLSTMFIVSALNPDDSGKIKDLLNELVYANWRGLDVRLIIGNSQEGIIEFANETSYRYLEKKGLPVKLYNYEYDASVHSKYVIIDEELIILGSANWTDNAMSENKEDSIAIYSEEAALKLKKEFEKVWEHGLEDKD